MGLLAVNNTEAEGIIDTELAKYRDWTYEQLSAITEAPKQSFEVIGESGTTYYVDVYARWDGEVGGPIRLWVTADDGGWRAFFVDTSGRERIPPRFTYATSFKEDRALVRSPGEALAIIDKTANFISNLDADMANEFSEGLAAARVGGLWGFVDLSGVWRVSPRFTRVDSFWHGLARVAWQGGHGYIDKTGRTVWSSDAK